MMVDQLQILLETTEEETQDQTNKVLIEELQSLGNIEPIIKEWSMASKMRIWLQEKRKDISNSVNEKYQSKSKQGHHEDQKDEGWEAIDTTDHQKDILKINQTEIRNEENEKIDMLVEKV